MKKRTLVLLVAAVSLMTCSCGKKAENAGVADANVSAAQSQQSSGGATSADTQDGVGSGGADQSGEAKAVSVSDAFSKEGDYHDPDGTDCSYSYHVPKLDSDSATAMHINSEYESLLGDIYRPVYEEKRALTCADSNLIDGNSLSYLDDNGDLTTIVPVAHSVEVDYIYKPFVLKQDDMTGKTAASSKKLEDTYDESFSATLEDDKLTVHYMGSSDAAEASSSDKATDYIVHGLYDNYKQMTCASMTENCYQYVYLLTEDGRIEFVDVSRGANGDPEKSYLCTSGPIFALKDIASLEVSNGESGNPNYPTVMAVGADGSKTDLWPITEAQQHCLCDGFTTDWATYITYNTDGGGSYKDYCLLQLTDWNQAELTMLNADAATEDRYVGLFNLLGITEEGCIYSYDFTDNNGESVFKGIASMYGEYPESFDSYPTMLRMTDMISSGIFTYEEGEEVIFRYAVKAADEHMGYLTLSEDDENGDITFDIDEVVWVDGTDKAAMQEYGLKYEDLTDDYAIVNEDPSTEQFTADRNDVYYAILTPDETYGYAVWTEVSSDEFLDALSKTEDKKMLVSYKYYEGGADDHALVSIGEVYVP